MTTRQQAQHQHQPHTKAPVIVRQPSIFTTFSRNLRSFLPLSSTVLPPVVTGADAGGTNVGVGSAGGAGSRRRPLSLGSPRSISANAGSMHSLAAAASSDEESITSVQWCDMEDVDGTSNLHGGAVKNPRWLVIAYASGVQIWDTSNLSSVREVLNLRNGSLHIRGRILHAAILPAPSNLDDVADELAPARPLIGILTSSQFTVYSLPSQSVIKQISFKDATQIHARSNFIVIASINPSTLHILSASSLAILHIIHLPSSIYPSIALSLRLLAYTSPPPPNLHLYGNHSAHTRQTFVSRASQKRERGERSHVSSNALRDTIGTSMIRVGGEVWNGMKALAAASPINIGGGSGDGLGEPPSTIGPTSCVADDTHRGYSKSAPAETMSSSLASNIDHNLPSSAATGANWITVLDLKPLLSGGSPRIVSRFAPFSLESVNRGDISRLWFGAGGGSGAIPTLCVAPRDGQRVAVFQIRVNRPVHLSSVNESNQNLEEDATLEMPLHWYDLRRGLTSAKVENVVWDNSGKWAGVSTANRTIHIFAPNPYGGPTDRPTHLSPRVFNTEQIQPLSTELSPIVRLRPSDIPTATPNNSSNGILETSHVAPFSYTFIPPNVSNTLPSSLLPQSSGTSHSSSPVTSFPLLSSSPQLHAALPQRPFQDVLVFNSTVGEMILYRIALDWSVHDSPGSMDQNPSSSIPSRGRNNAFGYSFSLPVSDFGSKTGRRTSTSGAQPVPVDARDDGNLVGKESVLATWNLKRGRDWAEVKGPSLFENSPVSALPGKKKDYSEFIAQAELSPFSHSSGILPKSIYLSHQFSFYMFSTWDYHALLDSHQLNNVIGDEVVFRRDVEISGTGSAKDNAENAEEMIFGFGDAVDLQGGPDIKSAESTTFRRNSASRTTTGHGTFDVPIATAIHSELDYSSQSPPTIPMFPNGVPAATGIGGKSPTSRILDHSIPPHLRRGAAVAGAVAVEGLGRIRREVGSIMRSPVLRAGTKERRRSVGGTSITTTSSSLSLSPSPHALEPMPLEFDESDEVFLEDDIEDIVQTEKEPDQVKHPEIGDTLKVVEGEAASTSGSVGVGPGSGASATASVSTPRTQPDEVSLEVPEWTKSHEGDDEAWDDEARATIAEAEMFDEISVAGFMDEDMGRYERKK